MGRYSNPNGRPLLAWLYDVEVTDRISRLHRELGFENR